MKVAVADASPLILLNRAGYLDFLAGLFSEVKIPQSVFDEICAGPPGDTLGSQLSGKSWIEVVHLPQPLKSLDYERLGRGETEVIDFARLSSDRIALLDDRAARRVAADLEVTVIGHCHLQLESRGITLVTVNKISTRLGAVGRVVIHISLTLKQI